MNGLVHCDLKVLPSFHQQEDSRVQCSVSYIYTQHINSHNILRNTNYNDKNVIINFEVKYYIHYAQKENIHLIQFFK